MTLGVLSISRASWQVRVRRKASKGGEFNKVSQAKTEGMNGTWAEGTAPAGARCQEQAG